MKINVNTFYRFLDILCSVSQKKKYTCIQSMKQLLQEKHQTVLQFQSVDDVEPALCSSLH